MCTLRINLKKGCGSLKIFKQLFIIFLLCLVGEVAANLLPFQMPASVISLVLLFLLLNFQWIKSETIKEISEFLLKNMAFFFIPAGVSIIEKLDFLKDKIFVLLVICFITIFLTFTVTAYTVIGVTKLINVKKERGK